MSKKTDTSSKSNQISNRSILGVIYVAAVLSLGLATYLGCFLQVRSEGVVNNSHNVRLDSFSDRTMRDRILASDSTVLTQTQMDGEKDKTRVYPFGDIFGHTAGHSAEDKTGIEASANFYLLTSHMDLVEQVGNELTGNENPGDDVYTTLDTELRQTAYTAPGARKGMVIAMEPDTGKVLTTVSKPSYNPNSLLENWEALTTQENKEGQLLNRTTRGLYPPGSTFKIVTALEYIREHPADYKSYQSDCDGVCEGGEYRIKCYHSTARSYQDFTLAFADSCSGAFVSLGLGMDLGKWNSTAGELLFNRPLPLSGTPYKQSAYNMRPGAGTWEILRTSIGRGTTQVMSLHNVTITAAIANGGTLMRPYFLDSVVSVGDETIKKFTPVTYGSLMSAKEAVGLTELMEVVVTEGAKSAMRTDVCMMAVKTGSVESETGRETHVWLIGFASAESPRLVVTVLVEEGGSGGKVVAPIAGQLFDIYAGR